MNTQTQYPTPRVQPHPEGDMGEEGKRSPRVVVYVSEERRRRLRKLAGRRFENEGGYASMSRVVNEILDTCLDEYEERLPVHSDDAPKKKR